MKNKLTRFHALSLIIVLFLSVCLTACNQNRTVQIKAALLYKMGAAQPVARTKFYLLSEDLETIKKKANSAYYTSSDVSILKSIDRDVGGEPRYGNIQSGINEDSIKEYIIATTTTDFEGNGKFENVPSGTYYIGGFTTTRSKDGYVVWSVKINSGNATEPILLDQNNAFKAEEY